MQKQKDLTVRDLMKLLKEATKQGLGKLPIGFSVIDTNAETQKTYVGNLWAFELSDIKIGSFANVDRGISLGAFRTTDDLTPEKIEELSKLAGVATPIKFDSLECTINRAKEHLDDRYQLSEEFIEHFNRERAKVALHIVKSDLKELLDLYGDLVSLLNEKNELLLQKDDDDDHSNK